MGGRLSGLSSKRRAAMSEHGIDPHLAWLANGSPPIAFEEWNALPSEVKNQFFIGEIRQIAEDADWSFAQHQAAERFAVDFGAEIGRDWNNPDFLAGAKSAKAKGGNGHDGEPFIPPNLDNSADRKLVAAKTTTVGNLTMEKIDWVWKGWLGRGIFHLIAGVPEAGKTTCALSVAAILSSGDRWPDGTPATPGNVLMWTGEDSPAQTIKPRLVQMGANVDKIWIVTGQPDENGKIRPFNPGIDLPSLRLAAEAIPGGIDFLIIDPIVSVIGAKLDNSNNAGHREKLQPLVDIATDLNCAVLGVTHFTKGTIGKDPCDRVTGSLAFGAVARIIMVATKNRQGDPERMLLIAKNNLTDTSGGFGYSIVGSPLYESPDIIASRIVWGERLDGTARELLAQAEDDGDGDDGGGHSATSAQEAIKFLASALARGERKQIDIVAEADAVGISEARLRRASTKLDIAKRKLGMDGHWLWKLR